MRRQRCGQACGRAREGRGAHPLAQLRLHVGQAAAAVADQGACLLEPLGAVLHGATHGERRGWQPGCIVHARGGLMQPRMSARRGACGAERNAGVMQVHCHISSNAIMCGCGPKRRHARTAAMSHAAISCAWKVPCDQTTGTSAMLPLLGTSTTQSHGTCPWLHDCWALSPLNR
jgi:hypothetical protein